MPPRADPPYWDPPCAEPPSDPSCKGGGRKKLPPAADADSWLAPVPDRLIGTRGGRPDGNEGVTMRLGG